VGLLFTITNCLYHLWLEIHLAKITTMVDQVLDVFYVTDNEGRKIEDPERLAVIRRELISALEAEAEPVAGGAAGGCRRAGWAEGGVRGGVVGLDGAVDAYLDHVATERGLARRTVEAYARDLAAFTRGLVARGLRAPGRIGEGEVRRHLAALGERGLSPRSQARALAAIPG